MSENCLSDVASFFRFNLGTNASLFYISKTGGNCLFILFGRKSY